ncbi:Aste57867_2553 [Aphanomyces stellatus]|uniref:Aste57867_2553 protein n=1 Tax=Aphanomyces stellatus TaxID=120398 RepID=A0A485K7T1_9STRA|nr:hypothetical protein As57867_002546 [Aphanomyces stellatus]VFT79750.1 Aste57867_2553 [Aphanomyces stellatus]
MSIDPSSILCFFNGCTHTAVSGGKCDLHKFRTKCSVDACRNQTYARNLCIKHGGKLKCQVDGCDANARGQGFCCKHGPKVTKKLCQVDGCTKVAHARHRCVRHGGGRACNVGLCTAIARRAGLCQRHSGCVVLTPDALSGTDDDVDDLVAMLDESLKQLDVAVWWQDESSNNSLDLTVDDCALLDYFITADVPSFNLY